jgi:hypothetical protein
MHKMEKKVNNYTKDSKTCKLYGFPIVLRKQKQILTCTLMTRIKSQGFVHKLVTTLAIANKKVYVFAALVISG